MAKKNNKKNKKKKFHLSTLIFILCLIAGLGLLLYPTVSDLYNQYQAQQTINSYKNEIKHTSPSKLEKVWKDAKKYNEDMAKRGQGNLTPEQKKRYEHTLNPGGNGIMGYIVIKKLKENIPIYHGSSDRVLQIGSGHLEWTSLPVGGKSSHAVMTGHRGLPSARLFTDLDKVKKGDKIVFHIMSHTLTYKVDGSQVILPTNYKPLKIIPGEDRITLMTCTPYGVNTHRLLVHAHRVPNDKESVKDAKPSMKPWLIVGGAALGVILLILLIRHFKKKKAAKAAEEGKAAAEKTAEG